MGVAPFEHRAARATMPAGIQARLGTEGLGGSFTGACGPRSFSTGGAVGAGVDASTRRTTGGAAASMTPGSDFACLLGVTTTRRARPLLTASTQYMTNARGHPGLKGKESLIALLLRGPAHCSSLCFRA